jgi:ribosomal-protein-alanine N-acetyltransferase
MHAKPITGEKIRLVPMILSFVNQIYLDWLKDPEVTFSIEFASQTMDELKKYVSEKIQNPKVAFWAIFDLISNEMVGTIKLEPIEFDKKVTNFGIMIGNKNVWGKGIGTEATQLAVSFAFNQLGLNKVELGVLKINENAIKAYEKAGFEKFGTEDNVILMDIKKIQS